MVTALIVAALILILGIVMAIFWQYTKFYFCALLYFVCLAIFKIMDFLQDLFLCFAGLETTGATGAESNGELLEGLLTNDNVKQAFFGLLALAIVLLVIFTVIQLIRVEYTTEGANNSKGTVLKSALKALTMFAIVPLFCAMGVMGGNALLKALNSATNTTGAKTLSGRLFLIGAYEGYPPKITDADYLKFVPGLGLTVYFESGGWNEAAEQQAVSAGLMADPSASFSQDDFIQNNKHTDFKAVTYSYDITKIGWGYIIIFAVGPIFIGVLYSAMCGLIMRLYMGVVLYVIQPPIIAMMVLDEGSAYKNWRQRFIGTVLSGYGAVVAFNLYMMIAEVVTGSDLIKFFSGGAMADFLNKATELIFLLVGAMSIKNISKTISSLIGADDALEQGEGVGKQITDKAKKVGKAAVGAATVAVGGIALAGAGAGGIAAKVAAKSGRSKAGKLMKANEGLSKKMNDAKGKKGRAEKMAARFKDSEAFKQYGKNFEDLDDKQKASVMSAVESDSRYQKTMSTISDTDSEISSLGSQMDENKASASKALNRGRKLYVTSARFAELGKSNITGMIGNSGAGKVFNQITGNAIKATGGKGFDQWDGEIMGHSDSSKKLMETYNSERQQKREDRHDKFGMGSIKYAYERQQGNKQNEDLGNSALSDAKARAEEMSDKETSIRVELDGLGKEFREAFGNGMPVSITDMSKATALAEQHKKMTGSNIMVDYVKELKAANDKMIAGDVAGAKKQLTEVQGKIDLNQKVETKVEAIMKKADSQLMSAIKSQNTVAIREAVDKLKADLMKEGVEIKGYEQLLTEIKNAASEAKKNEKQLTKLVAQLGKMANK